MRRKLRNSLSALFTCVTLILMAAPVAAQDEIQFRLDWLVNGYHAPFYVALDKGWYSDAGLDVSIEPGRGSGETVRIVGAGGAPLGFANASAASKAVSEGVPLTVVAIILQKTGMGIASMGDQEIRTPQDLVGKTVGIVPEDGASRLLPALLRINGIDTQQVNTVSSTFATQIPSLLTGRADAITGYVMGEYIGARNGAPNRTVNWLTYDDFGVTMYSNGIVGNRDFVRSNPDAVQKFVDVTLRAIEWSVANVDAAVDILAEHTDTEKAMLKQQLELAIPLFSEGDSFDASKLGNMTDEKWAETQRLMVEFGGQDSVVPASELYTTQFIR